MTTIDQLEKDFEDFYHRTAGDSNLSEFWEHLKAVQAATLEESTETQRLACQVTQLREALTGSLNALKVLHTVCKIEGLKLGAEAAQTLIDGATAVLRDTEK